MNNDQAKNLRKLMGKTKIDENTENDKKTNMHAFIGKEGSGNTTIVSNLANAISKDGKRVVIVDFNSGILTTDIFFNVFPNYNLKKVLQDEKSEKEMLLKVRDNIYLVYGREILSSSESEKILFKQNLDKLKINSDAVILDIEGIGEMEKLCFLLKESNIVFISSPDVESVKETYYGIKYLKEKIDIEKADLIVNKIKSEKEAQAIFQKIDSTAKKFIDVKVKNIGNVSHESLVKDCISRQSLFTDLYPDSDISYEIFNLKQYF